MNPLTVILLPFALCLLLAAPGGADDGKPNILYINVDDLGAMDVGFAGDRRYRTPSIDRLAGEGMVFTQGYAPAANCAPSRAGVFTGQYAPRHGVYTVGESARGKRRLRKLIPVKNTRHVPHDNVLLSQALQAGGYVTANLGKWHISRDPTTRGFDVNLGGSQAGHPKSYHSPYRNPHLRDGPEGEYLTDRLADEAIRFLEENRKRRFFLVLSFFAVHTPLQARHDLLEHYRGREDVDPRYAAMVECVDASVGRIMKALDRLGLRDDTLVVFTSDNGALAKISGQAPLRGGKGTSYEGGLRVPLAIRWPARVAAGATCDVPVAGIDFYPTFLAAAGIEKPEGKTLDGESLLPLLLTQTEPFPDRALFWHFPVYLQADGRRGTGNRDPHFRTRPGCAMRYGRWKLHEFFEDGAFELYDLECDPGESNNLANTESEKLAELAKKMRAWREAVHAPVPTDPNPAHRPEGGGR